MIISGDGSITGLVAGGLPDATVTQAEVATGVAGTGPALSAYHGGTAQVINAAAWTKVRIDTEEFDTASCFDSATNYRFTPTIAGYYQVSAAVQFAGGATNAASIYKNGAIYKAGSVILNPYGQASNVSTLVYMNGSTDYVEFYAYSNVTATLLNNSGSTWFNGCLVRSAA